MLALETNDFTPKPEEDAMIESRIFSDARLIRDGAHVIAGVLAITDEQYEELRHPHETAEKAETRQSVETEMNQDYPVRLMDFEKFLSDSAMAWRYGDGKEPAWNSNRTAGTATRAWNALVRSRNNSGRYTADGGIEYYNPMEDMGLKELTFEDADTPQERYALSGRSLEQAIHTETFENLMNLGKQGQRFVEAFVAHKIQEREQAEEADVAA